MKAFPTRSRSANRDITHSSSSTVWDPGALATRDLAAAISYIFRHAATLGVAAEGYSLWGSSAGARMAAAIGSHGVASFGGDNLPKPSAVVMAYTAHSDHSADEPPTFVVVGERDGIAPPSVMEHRVAALRRTGAEVEFHRYRDIGHGFGPGIGTTAEGWLDRAIEFWEKVMAAHAEFGADGMNRRRVRSCEVCSCREPPARAHDRAKQGVGNDAHGGTAQAALPPTRSGEGLLARVSVSKRGNS